MNDLTLAGVNIVSHSRNDITFKNAANDIFYIGSRNGSWNISSQDPTSDIRKEFGSVPNADEIIKLVN